MADRFRIVTIGDDGRARLVRELEGGDAIFKGRDTFRVQKGSRRARSATAQGVRYGGSVSLSDDRDNDQLQVTLHVKGSNALQAAKRLETMLEALDSTSQSLFIEWMPQGLTRPVYSHIRGTATWQPAYSAVQFPQIYRVPFEVSWPVAPLPQGLPLDVLDRFEPPSDKDGGAVNEIFNPQGFTFPGAALPEGWGASLSAGSALATIADFDLGRIAGAWTAAAFASNVGAFNIGRGGTGGGVDAVPVEPGERIGVRFRFKVASSTLQPIQTVAVQLQGWNQGGGALSAIGLNSGTGELQSIANPVTGTIYEAAGYIDVPATGERFLSLRVRLQLANAGGTFDIRIGRAAFYRMAAGETKVPAYGDGDGPMHRWDGERHRSRSIELDESQLAEYTRSGASGGRQREAVGDFGFVGYEVASQAIIHTGREPTPDHEALVRGRIDAAGAAGSTDYSLTPGVRWDPVRGTGFWAAVQGAALRIYRRNRDGTNTTVASSAALTTPLAVGKREWIICRAVGNEIIAERYLRNPYAGRINYDDFARYLIPAAEQEEWGAERAGYPAMKAWTMNPSNVDATPAQTTIERFEARAYYYPAPNLKTEEPTAKPNSLDPLRLRKIPGTAPALLDIGCAPYFTGGWPPVQSAFHSWRRRRRGRAGIDVENMIWNGDQGAGIAGWKNPAVATDPSSTHLNAGAGLDFGQQGGPTTEIQRYLEFTSGAAANTGRMFRVARRFKRGQVYTLEFYAHRVGGAASWQVMVDLQSAAQTGLSQVFDSTFAAGPLRYTFVPTADRDWADVIFRFNPAGAGAVMRIAGLKLYEGTKPPALTSQQHGRGGFAPFGRLQAEQWARAMPNDQSAGATNLTIGDVADTYVSPSDRLITFPVPAYPGNSLGLAWSFIEWMVDPALIEPDAFEDDELDVDVWIYGSWSNTVDILMRGYSVPDAQSGWSAIAGSWPGRIYTREYGVDGRRIPFNGEAKLAWRVGTVTLSRKGGRHRVGLEFLSTGAAQTIRPDWLFFMPSSSRMMSPTGKVATLNDWGTVPDYPRYLLGNGSDFNSGRDLKWTLSDGDGQLETMPEPPAGGIGGFIPGLGGGVGLPDYQAVPALGLGGDVMELPPGDNEIVAALFQSYVPDIAGGGGGSHQNISAAAVRARITPRYRLMAPSS